MSTRHGGRGTASEPLIGLLCCTFTNDFFDRAIDSLVFTRRLGLAATVVGQASTGGNKATDDDVFLETTEFIALAHDGSFGEHAGGFLEGRGGNERVGRQRRLGDTEQHVIEGRRQLAFRIGTIVFGQQFGTLNLFGFDELGVTRLDDGHAAQHLANDHFDVLVVDLHTLQTIDVLHFVGDVTSQRLDALQTQAIVRIRFAFDDLLALVHHLAVVHQNVLVLGDQELVSIAVEIGNDQTLLALGVLTKADGAGGFGQHGSILRRTGFEQFGNARQTDGNVAGLGRFLRHTGEHVTNTELLAVGQRDDGTDLEGDGNRMIATGDLDFHAVFVEQLDDRTNTLGGSLAATLVVDHDEGGQAGHVVNLLGDGNAFLDVLEPHDTGVLGNDRTSMRIPRRQLGTGLNGLAFVSRQDGAIRNLVAFAFTTVIVNNQHFAGAGDNDLLTLGAGHKAHVAGITNGTGRLTFDLVGNGSTGRRTTDVEGTHGELGTRFTDRLGSDNANGFTGIDHGAAAEIATVALGAQTVTGFAGQRGANLDFVDTQLVDQVDQIFVQHRAGEDDGFLGFRIDQIVDRDTTENTLAQRLDNLTAFDQPPHRDARRG